MKIVYASRTGHVEILMNKLNINNPTRIMSGDEKVDEDFLLFTYTDGYGDIPAEVETFLEHHVSYIKGVIASGDTGYGEAFAQSGNKISEAYNVPYLYKIEKFKIDDNKIPIAKIKTINNIRYLVNPS